MSVELEVRIGTQPNCAGFTVIKVKLNAVTSPDELAFINRASNIPEDYWPSKAFEKTIWYTVIPK